MDSEGWQPPLHDKGAEIVNDDHRFLLVTGAKLSTKTISICHKICKHLYEQRGAHVGIVVKRSEVGRLGVWPDLTEFVIPKQWQEPTGMLKWAFRPKTLSDTKRRVFSVRNYRGEVNQCSLISAYRASEIEAILKNTRFSFIYVNEADQFPATIFNACADQLRLEHRGVPQSQHQLVLDCNPPDEGDKHWLYKVFFDPPDKDEIWHRDYNVITATIDDNPWLSEQDLSSLIQRYKNNPRMFARYVLSQWVPSQEGSIFQSTFDEGTHVIGEVHPTKPKNEWALLLPPRGTTEIVRGWDLGDVNHACVFYTKRLFNDMYCYDVIDDVTSVEKPMSIRTFTQMVVARSSFWEKVLKARGADMVTWRDWGDPSAFNFRSTGEGGSHAAEVLSASKNKIQIRPVRKGPGSVASRVAMTMRLLMDRRLMISVLARNVVNSLIGIKHNTTGGVLRSRLLHAYDALTYGISGEITLDLKDEAFETDESRDKRNGGVTRSLISVRL